MTPEQIAAMQLENQEQKKKLETYAQAEKEQADKLAFQQTVNDLKLSSLGKSLLETSGLKDPEKIKAFIELNKEKTVLFEDENATNTSNSTHINPNGNGKINPPPKEQQQPTPDQKKANINDKNFFVEGFTDTIIKR